MSDVLSSNTVGEIHITINDNSVSYDSPTLSIPEVVFWIDLCKNLILNNVISPKGDK